MPEREPLGFGDVYASPGDHIGHFYQTKQEQRDILSAYLKAGLDADQTCVSLHPRKEREDLEKALAAVGIDVGGGVASGRLVLDEGQGDPKNMQAMLEDALAEVKQRSSLLRWAGDMTWSVGKMATTETLMQWETHCNVVEDPRAIFLCQYDLRRFRGDVVMDALRTHPLCVVSNVIHQNPYYEDPETLLKELRERESTTLA